MQNNELSAKELYERAKANNEIPDLKRYIYILKDEDAGFAQVMEHPNHMTALRTFGIICQDKNNVSIQMNPEKYSMWYIGNYSSKTGKIEPVEPMKLGEATSYAPEKKHENNNP